MIKYYSNKSAVGRITCNIKKKVYPGSMYTYDMRTI